MTSVLTAEQAFVLAMSSVTQVPDRNTFCDLTIRAEEFKNLGVPWLVLLARYIADEDKSTYRSKNYRVVLAWLLEEDSDNITATDNYGKNFIHVCASIGTELLCEFASDAITKASIEGGGRPKQTLLDALRDEEQTANLTPLSLAIRNKNIEVAKLLIRFSPTSVLKGALTWAKENGFNCPETNVALVAIDGQLTFRSLKGQKKRFRKVRKESPDFAVDTPRTFYLVKHPTDFVDAQTLKKIVFPFSYESDWLGREWFMVGFGTTRTTHVRKRLRSEFERVDAQKVYKKPFCLPTDALVLSERAGCEAGMANWLERTIKAIHRFCRMTLTDSGVLKSRLAIHSLAYPVDHPACREYDFLGWSTETMLVSATLWGALQQMSAPDPDPVVGFRQIQNLSFEDLLNTLFSEEYVQFYKRCNNAPRLAIRHSPPRGTEIAAVDRTTHNHVDDASSSSSSVDSYLF